MRTICYICSVNNQISKTMIEVQNEQFITLTEACSFLGLRTIEGLRRWRQRNGVQCLKIGRHSYIRKSDVENAILNAPAADRGRQPLIVRQEGDNTYRYLTVDKSGTRSSLRVTYAAGKAPSRDTVKEIYISLRGKSDDLPHDLLAELGQAVGWDNVFEAMIG